MIDDYLPAPKDEASRLPLKPIEILFCKEYIVDSNGSAAAIRAGFKNGSPATRMLKNKKVIDKINAMMDAKLKRAEVTTDYVLATIKRAVEQAVSDGDTKNIYKGCELLGKHLKLFTDVLEHKFEINQMGRIEAIDNETGELEEITFNIGSDPNSIDNAKK